MSEQPGKLAALLNELKRRHVFQVAASYAVVVFVVLQVAEVTFGPLQLPERAMTWLVVVCILGFPVTVLLAWMFDLTPTGIHRTRATGEDGAARATAQRQFFVVVTVALLLTGGIGFGVTSRYLGAEAGAGAAAARSDTDVSVAVLPFANMSPDSSNEYLSDGITEDILTALARIEGLRVVSRTSVMKYKGSDLSVPEIAAQLGVTHILEGSVRRMGDELRISAQLIDARTDEHLWAQSFDRRVDDLFQIQSEIAQEIATALAGELSTSELAQLAAPPTRNLEAYDLYLRARSKLSALRTRDLDSATVMLREALRLDPRFALAYAELGKAYLQRATVTGVGTWRDSAFAAAQSALEMDARLADAHLVLGAFLLANGQAQQAIDAYEEAQRLKPNMASAIAGIANVHSSLGRYDEALRWYLRAAQSEPTSAWNQLYVAYTYSSLGDFGKARDWARRALRLQTDLWAAHAFLAQLDVQEGQTAKAADRVAAMLRVAGEEPLALAAAGSVELRRGNFQAARGYYERLLQVAPSSELEPTTPLGFIAWKTGDLESAAESFRESASRVGQRFFEGGSDAPLLYYEMAQIHAAQGDGAGALQYLTEAIDRGFRDYFHLRSDPLFESLRGDSRFQETLATLRDDVEQMRQQVLRTRVA